MHTPSSSCGNAWWWQPVWDVVFSLAAAEGGMKCFCGGVPRPWRQPHGNVSVPAVAVVGSPHSHTWAAAGWGSAGRGLSRDKEYSFYHEPHGNPQILRKIVLMRKVMAGTRWFNQSVVKSSNNCLHMKLYHREGKEEDLALTDLWKHWFLMYCFVTLYVVIAHAYY